jgi:hypothetical protein
MIYLFYLNMIYLFTPSFASNWHINLQLYLGHSMLILMSFVAHVHLNNEYI